MNTIQYSPEAVRYSAICNRSLTGPTRVLNANGISIASEFSAGLTRSIGDRPTDHTTRSFTIGGIYLHGTAMWSNNCSISTLLDCFPCLYHRTERGSRRQESSLRRRWGIAWL